MRCATLELPAPSGSAVHAAVAGVVGHGEEEGGRLFDVVHGALVAPASDDVRLGRRSKACSLKGIA